MSKKKISLFLAMVMAAAAISGCAGQTSDSTSSGNTTQSAASAVSTQTESSDEISQSSSVSETTSEQQDSSSESSAQDSKTSSAESSDNNKKSESSPDSSKPSGETSKGSSSQSEKAESSHKTSDKPESSKQESSKQESSKQESSKQESSKQESSKQESSKQESSKQESSKQESSKSDTTQKITKNDAAIGDINTYNELFNINTKVTVQISMSQSEINKLQADYNKYSDDDNKKSEIYRKADVTITVGSKTYTINEVGIRLKGNTSLDPFYAENGSLNISHYKLSFDETFDDKTEYGSEAKVWSNENERKLRKKRTFATLNGLDIKWNRNYDETHIREIYATKLFEASDVLVQKINLSQLKFNGNNYGVVNIYEPIDKTFLEKRLPESAIGGDLYKCAWGKIGGRFSGATYTTSTISSIGETVNSTGKKYIYSIKTNKSSTDHSALKNLIRTINKSNPSKDSIESVIDINYYARFMAACYFAGDPDDIRNNYNNHYLYFRKDTGKAIFIPYDNDRTLGVTYGYNPDGKGCSDRNPYSGWAAGADNGQENPLIKLTIIDNNNSTFNYVKDLYTKQLKVLAASDMMKSDADFNKTYNIAKKNYESVVTPSVKFDNVEETFKFSLNGRIDSQKYATANMSFEMFRSAIMAKYKSKVK